MDQFSLEEEGNELFLTQEVTQNDGICKRQDEEDDTVFGIDRNLFDDMVNQAEGVPHYSDISDVEEVFEKPTFQ